MGKLKKSSVKTTLVGLAAALAVVLQSLYLLLDGDPETVPDWDQLSFAILVGVGFYLARDNDKSSESVGAK